MHPWCQLVTLEYEKLLLLGKLRANPKISAYEHLYVPHDYSMLPFVRIIIEALINKNQHSEELLQNTAKINM